MMEKKNNLYKWMLIPALLIIGIISCNKKYEGDDNSLETLRNANNNATYSKTKLDSLQATNVITSQKVQDLLDLSALYTSGNKDTEIDSVIYTQMQAHFLTKDSNNLKPLLKEMDSLKVRYAKVNNLMTSKKIKEKDTLDFATFDVEYYDNKRTYITQLIEKHNIC
jgi:intracellular sulfur oxidation DsrE/DsrF family protein